MSLTTRVGLCAGLSALALSGASFADNSDNQNLNTRISDLEAQLAELKGESWMTEQRAEEIRGLVHEVLADADTRASLLSANMQGGYDEGFVLGSPDGNFSLKVNGQLQARFIYNNQDDGPGVDTNRWGFENTRTKLIFSGNVGGPQWGYYIEGNFLGHTVPGSGNGGDFSLEDAWISHDCGNGWTVMAGQFKAPHQREWNVHSSNQLAVERSNVSYLYNGGRVQGLAVDYRNDMWHFIGTVNDGTFSSNTAWNAYDTEYAVGARVEALLSGNWDQFDTFTSPQGSENGILVGGGAHFQNGEYGTAASETELLILTADVSFEFDGANIFGAINYAHSDVSGGGNFDTFGFVVQGGYFFNADWEGFARYEWNDFDTAGVDDISLLTVGVNRYWGEHVKWTTDVGFGFDSAAGVSTITGWRTDPAGSDGQFVIRSQWQLVF